MVFGCVVMQHLAWIPHVEQLTTYQAFLEVVPLSHGGWTANLHPNHARRRVVEWTATDCAAAGLFLSVTFLTLLGGPPHHPRRRPALGLAVDDARAVGPDQLPMVSAHRPLCGVPSFLGEQLAPSPDRAVRGCFQSGGTRARN
jgi:hypothetical protein